MRVHDDGLPERLELVHADRHALDVDGREGLEATRPVVPDEDVALNLPVIRAS